MATNYQKIANGRIECIECLKSGKKISFATTSSFYKHRRNNHTMTQTIIKPTGVSVAEILSRQIEQLTNKIDKLPVTNSQNTQNITNNVNMYFNKELKYFNELVKIMGRENALNHLLYTGPKIKNPFDSLKRIFAHGDIPICISDTGIFHIIRSNSDVEKDDTGEIIDIENKRKLKDAIVAAFTESTKERDRRLREIRLAQAQDGTGEFRPYTVDEMNEINQVYEHTEPRMLYNLLDNVDNCKTRKCDFDDLRKICPKLQGI